MTGFYVKYNWCSSREKDVYVDIVAIWEDGNGSSLYDEFIKVDMLLHLNSFADTCKSEVFMCVCC